jgi:hypothetical protein
MLKCTMLIGFAQRTAGILAQLLMADETRMPDPEALP